MDSRSLRRNVSYANCIAVLAVIRGTVPALASGSHHVRGHVTKRGTYVDTIGRQILISRN